MRKSGRILFILGFVLAAFAAAGLYWAVINTKPPPPTVPTSKLVVAFQPVVQRSEIDAAQIGLIDWPQTVPTPIGAFESSNDVIGKLAKAEIGAGQPILESMLIDKSDLGDLYGNASLVVDEGQRAVAMPIKIDSNVAEAVQVGDYVDLVVTFAAQSTAGGVSEQLIVTHHLMQDVLVLQVGPWPNTDAATTSNPEAGGGTKGYTVITFQMNLQDAQVLKYAQLNAADVSLALRRANDHTLEETEPVTLDYINKRFGYQLPTIGR